MVQVDVFWSYAIGAGFAAAAGRQIMDEPRTTDSPYYRKTLIYLATLFAPSGVMLLWIFTAWETMYFWDRQTLPGYLVPVFCITNVTQGMLGFWITHKLIKSREWFWANMQWVFGYLFMFFILVHGWDGKGYRRFFTYTANQKAQVLAQGFGPWVALKWAVSPVALTLYAMGVIMLPVMFYWIGKWATEGYKLGYVDKERARYVTVGGVVKLVCRIVFLDTLGSAIVWSLLIHVIGWGWGTLVFAPLFGFVCCGPSGIIRKDINRLTLEPAAGSAPEGVVARAET